MAELEAKFNLKLFPLLLDFTLFVSCLTLTPESNLEQDFSFPCFHPEDLGKVDASPGYLR